MATATAVAFKDGKRRLVELLEPPLKDRGFRYLKELSFGRESPRAVQIISFGSRRGRAGEFCVSFGAGVRFPEVEVLLRPGDDDDLRTTIAKPLSVMKPCPAFPEWCFDGERAPEDLALEIMADVDAYAIPLLERYSSLDEVERSLRSESAADWFVLNPEQRLVTLSALEHTQGRHGDALERLDAALAALQDAPMKKRWPLQKLRERLASTEA